MMSSNAVAVALVAGNGVIDKLELETIIPKSSRDFLAGYQTKLAAGNTRKDEDMQFLKIFEVWLLQRHRMTA